MRNALTSLNQWQQAQRFLFESPNQGITSWAVNKIEDFEKGELVSYPKYQARLVKRVIAIAMPLFAILDVGQFSGKMLFKAITLCPEEALNNLYDCALSIKLLVTSLFIIPLAILNPISIYRSENNWEEIADQQNQEATLNVFEEKFKLVDQKDKKESTKCLKEAIKETCYPLILSVEGKSAFEKALETLDLPPKTFEENETLGQNVILRDYIQIFSKFAVKLGDKDCAIPEDLCKDFADIVQKINAIRKPELRKKLIDFLMESLQDDRSIFKNWKTTLEDEAKKGKNSLNERAHVAFFSTHLLINDPELLKKMREICLNANFKDDLKMQTLIEFFVDLSSANLNSEIKENFLKILHNSYSKGKNLKEKAAKILELIKTFDLLIKVENEDIINTCLQNDDFDNKKIQEILFNITFEVKFDEKQFANLFKKMRAPWTFIYFHMRLKKLSGDEREDALDASRKCLEWVANDVYQKEWHDEESNPHLNKIFSTYPDLKTKWINGFSTKVDTLVSEPYEKYKNFIVEDSCDPSDILLYGMECNNCLNLQGGRLHKIKGLIGFIMDGKTHKIMIKDEKGKIWASAGLQLLWDKTNERPVLFIESISCSIDKKSNGGQTLIKSLIAYADKRALELGLDLAGHFVKKDASWEYERSQTFSKSPYLGDIGSLGSPSPLEYVNPHLCVKSGAYSVGATALIKESYQERTVSIQYNNQTWTLNPIEERLDHEAGTSKQYKAVLSLASGSNQTRVRVKQSCSLNEAIIFHQIRVKNDSLRNVVPDCIAVLDKNNNQLDLEKLLENHSREELCTMELYKPVQIIMKDLQHNLENNSEAEGAAQDFKFAKSSLLQESKRISRQHGLKERSSTHKAFKKAYFRLSDCSFAFGEARKEKGLQALFADVQNVFNIGNTKEMIREQFSRLEPTQLTKVKAQLKELKKSFKSSDYVFFDSSLLFIPVIRKEGERNIADLEIRLIDLSAGWSKEEINKTSDKYQKDLNKHEKLQKEMVDSVKELISLVDLVIDEKQKLICV